MVHALKHLSSSLLKDFPRIHPKSIVLLIFRSHNCIIWPIYWQESWEMLIKKKKKQGLLSAQTKSSLEKKREMGIW